jgi:hypothetical protein
LEVCPILSGFPNGLRDTECLTPNLWWGGVLGVLGSDVFRPIKGALLVVFAVVHVDLPAATDRPSDNIRRVWFQYETGRTTTYALDYGDEVGELV